eukprot:scaffold12889_cov105-Isochrysis_galbana.AAC.4
MFELRGLSAFGGTGVISTVHTPESSHPRDRWGGPEELNFARVGGGRPDLDEGRGVGTGPSVSILGLPSGNSFWPIGPIEPGLEPEDEQKMLRLVESSGGLLGPSGFLLAN